MDVLLNLVIFLPIVGALLVWLLPAPASVAVDPHGAPHGEAPAAVAAPVNNYPSPRWTAAFFTGLVLALSVLLLFSFDRARAGFQFETNTPWIPFLGVNYHIGVDGISMPLVVLNALLTFLAVLVAWNLPLRPKEFFALVMVLETAVFGVFTSLDFVLFFLFWELELAPMFLLIGVWGGPRREYAAMKFLLYTVLGGGFILLGTLVLYFGAGLRTFDMVVLSAQQYALPLQTAAFLLLAVGFAIKLPVFPFHTWLPDAHVEAPTAISVLLAGVLLKMGGYGLIRICVTVLPDAAKQFALLIMILAVINILYGAMVALAQTDMKKIIANSSISHMGFVLLGIGAMNQIGLEGAVLQLFTHGTITGLLFMMVGLVYDRTHTRDVRELGGLGAQIPIIATSFVIAGLASLGLPGLSGFVAEFLVFVGGFKGGDVWGRTWPILTALGAFGVVLSAGYILWLLERVFYGPISDRWRGLPDATRLEYFYVGALIGVIVLFGLYPNLLLDIIANSVTPIVTRLGFSGY